MSPDSIIRDFQLLPHPEGGHYREIFRSIETVQASGGRGTRPALTLIHFLLRQGEFSAWHSVLSDEIWHWCAGSPVELWLMGRDMESFILKKLIGPLGAPGTMPSHVVPAGWWQAARPIGDWSMVQCAVAPGFDFADFTMLRDVPHAAALVQERYPDASLLLG